jgi:hypothetical protein
MMLYVITVSGFALNLHYCFNRLASVKIDAPASCVKGLETSKMKCCKDRHFEVKVKDAHQNSAASFLAKIFSFDLPKLPFAAFSFSVQNNFTERLSERGPPPSPDVPVFLKNCIFRI